MEVQNTSLYKNLSIICYFHWRTHAAMYINDAAGLHAAVAQWVTPFTSEEEILNVLTYPTYTFPDVCVCGTVFSHSGSNLRYHCFNCEGNSQYRKLCRYDMQLIIDVVCRPYHKYFRTHPAAIEAIFASVIFSHAMQSTWNKIDIKQEFQEQYMLQPLTQEAREKLYYERNN